MEELFMSIRTRLLSLFLSSLLVTIFIGSRAADADKGVTLYTPFTKISVPPGQSIDYNIDVINNTSSVQRVDISVSGLSKAWDYTIKSGGWNISQVSVLPNDKKSISMKLEVPLKVNKGSYHFRIMGNGQELLPLVVTVSQQGTYETELTTDQPNMEGHANSTFTFRANLKNRTADTQIYALETNVPRGWDVTFKTGGKEVSSVSVDANNAQDITVQVAPPAEVEAGTYKIPVRATTSSTSADVMFEVVVTGTYKMDLSTPTGLLSAGITAGGEKDIDLVVKNIGSAELKDIKLTASKPADWSVDFNPQKIDRLKAGETAQVTAKIKASSKAIAGDYVTKIEAKTPEVNSSAEFRMAVKTPMLWGWLGILIIIAAGGSVYYLFRKYGRR